MDEMDKMDLMDEMDLMDGMDRSRLGEKGAGQGRPWRIGFCPYRP